MPERVAVLGKGELAIRAGRWLAASADHSLVTVVPVYPEPDWAPSFATWAAGAGVPAIESGDYRELDPDSFDLALSIFYDRIFDKPFIDRCTRLVNLHNGPLPRYRGVAPINWALKNGEDSHGVTLHEISPGVDDGPIVSQVRFSIYPEIDEVVDVYARALEFGWTLLEQTLPMLNLITPVAQREEEATLYPRSRSSELGERSGFTRQTPG